MQIELQFSSSGENVLSFDYQYELASALYRTLTARSPALAKELHDGAQRNRIKLFVFSLFSSEPKPEVVKLPDGRSGLKFGKRVWMRFGSIWPELLYQMADALQQAGELNICGQKFHLESLEMVKSPESYVLTRKRERPSIRCRMTPSREFPPAVNSSRGTSGTNYCGCGRSALTYLKTSCRSAT